MSLIRIDFDFTLDLPCHGHGSHTLLRFGFFVQLGGSFGVVIGFLDRYSVRRGRYRLTVQVVHGREFVAPAKARHAAMRSGRKSVSQSCAHGSRP